MRSMASIPQQILRAALLGPLSAALQHARLAHSRGEWNLIDGSVAAPGTANAVRGEVEAGRLTEDRALLIAEQLLRERGRIPFAAALVLIEYWRDEPDVPVCLPGQDVLELLVMLALEQDDTDARRLLAAAVALAT